MARGLFLLVLFVFLAGCQSGTFRIPKEEFQQQVRTLAVLPILVDGDSVVKHPQREEVVALLRRHSDGREEELVRMLRDSGAFFDVRHVNQDPRPLMRQFVMPNPAVGQEEGFPYTFSAAVARDLTRQQVVDALVVVILHGREVVEKRWDRTKLSYLEAPYNNIVAAAAVVDASGNVLWRLGQGYGETFLALQYPDFAEAHYNKSDAVRLKYLFVEGVERTLAEPPGGLLNKSAFPKIYMELFEAIRDGLKPGIRNPFKGSAKPVS